MDLHCGGGTLSDLLWSDRGVCRLWDFLCDILAFDWRLFGCCNLWNPRLPEVSGTCAAVTQILIFGCIPAAAESSLDYVIVLGAKVKPDGSISKTLKLRLDKALEYIKENPDTMLVLSGAKGDAEPCSEAEAMETYLLEQGADAGHLLKEEQSFSTVENLAYSRILIEEREEKLLQEQKQKAKEDRMLRAPGEAADAFSKELQKKEAPLTVREPRIGILSSNFHLCRAELIAKKQNYGTVYGIASEADRVLLVHFALRDGIALFKDRLMGNL